jgi:UDP-3-O-[3-hydroxymyristoyl] glucosamine N-acyltransferase
VPDPRFYEDLKPIAARDLSAIAGARLAHDEEGGRVIAQAAPLDRADHRSVSFCTGGRYLDDLQATAAGACFIDEGQVPRVPSGCVALITAEPQVAFAKAAGRLHRVRRQEAGGPRVHPSCMLEDGVMLHHGVVVGPDVRIGEGSQIGPNSVIGPGVAIGRRCRIGANVSIGFALIGDDVNVLAGAVIGESGFGVAVGKAGSIDVPHLGRVIIQDHVSVGANTCIDRGAWDDTVIGEHTKIDNLVQIAHNVRVGRNCLLAGHVGLSGSVVVGDGASFGGRAGIADHLSIGAGVQIAAAAGVMHDVPAGERWAGVPAKPVRRFMREMAWLARMAGAREGNGAK